jgi:drug/metabolite transporter (DMT)-like permease
VRLGGATQRWLAIAAAATISVQVGSAMVATRYVVGQTGPASLALLRYAIGVCVLAPAVLAAGPLPRFARRDLMPIALLGISQFGILITLLNHGLRVVPSARAALIFATLPLITMLFAALIGHERLTWWKIAGVVLSIAGVGIAVGEKAVEGAALPREWLGELLVLASAVTGAVCSVLYRPYVRRYPALPVSALAMLASVAFLAVPAANEGFFSRVPTFTPLGWGAVLFIGLGSGIGYFLWLWALGHAEATRVTVFLSLSPITAAILGAWWLSERVSAAALAGLAAVVVGLWLAHRGPQATPARSAVETVSGPGIPDVASPRTP